MATAKEDPKEVVYPISLTKPSVWIGFDQTPITPGTYHRLIDIGDSDGSIALQMLAGDRVDLPKDQLSTYVDQRLIAVKTQIDKKVTETDFTNWDNFEGKVHSNEAPYLPHNKTAKEFLSDNLPGETSASNPTLPEISVMTAQTLRRSGVQAVVIQNSGKETPYQTTAMLSMVVNRTSGRITLVDIADNNPSFHTRDNAKIEQITTISREVKTPPTS